MTTKILNSPRKFAAHMRIAIAIIIAALAVISLGAGYAGSVTVPADSQLVVAATQTIRNDADIGSFGPWALDDYNRLVFIFKLADGSYSGIVQYVGSWQSYAGIRSPVAGILSTHDSTGNFHGAYMVHFNADSCISLKGVLTEQDRGASKETILAGTRDAIPSDIEQFCNGVADLEIRDWQWQYSNGDQQWIVTKKGSSGDIVN